MKLTTVPTFLALSCVGIFYLVPEIVNEPARKRKKHSEEADANVVDTEIPTNAGDWDMDWLAAGLSYGISKIPATLR